MQNYAKTTELSTHQLTAPRRSAFARDIAAAEFGGRYWGWREWADHVDVEPGTLAKKRFRAIWGPR